MRKPGTANGAEERPASSFLTPEQREALDAALLKKREEQTSECGALVHCCLSVCLDTSCVQMAMRSPRRWGRQNGC